MSGLSVLYYTVKSYSYFHPFGVSFITLGFLRAPPSVRSLVLRDVSLPGGVGEDRLLTRPGSPLPAVKLRLAPLLRPEELGTLALSPESVILWYQVLLVVFNVASGRRRGVSRDKKPSFYCAHNEWCYSLGHVVPFLGNNCSSKSVLAEWVHSRPSVALVTDPVLQSYRFPFLLCPSYWKHLEKHTVWAKHRSIYATQHNNSLFLHFVRARDMKTYRAKRHKSFRFRKPDYH